MRIFIPTYRRGPGQQATVAALGRDLCLQYRATLVVDEEDADALAGWSDDAGVELLVSPAQGDVSRVRQWVLDNTDDPHVLMLDDDLGSWAAPERTGGLRKADRADLELMLEDLDTLAGKYVHGGVGPRQMANRRPLFQENQKCIRANYYDAAALARLGVRYRLPLMEDYDLQLQLLELGQPSYQYNAVVQDAAANSSGGCSQQRTSEAQTAAAHKLAELHPGVVKVATKRTKGGQGMWAERTDVTVQWAKAYESGQALADIL